MNSGFGARLRLQREQQQITLAAIAEKTKIKASLLERLEQDDVSQWPKGIFRRAYIRDYAKAIGLEPDAIAREFLELYPDAEEEAATAALAAARLGAGNWPPTRLHLLIGSAIDALPSRRAQAGRRNDPVAERAGVASASSARPSEPAPAPVRAEAGVDRDTAAGRAGAEPVNVEPVVDPVRVDPVRVDVDISGVADVCTRLSCTADEGELRHVVGDAARMLNAVGLIVWVWNPQANALLVGPSYGYDAEMLAQLSRVRVDADNAIATAFRAVTSRVVDSTEHATGAVVVPLLTPCGCSGVLAVELPAGSEQHPSLLAVATILAAQLSTLVGPASALHAASA
jgi:transcriptional regulator with XRE-family HTH domain